MKKLSQSMRSNFIKLDWRHCPNYVAKVGRCRLKPVFASTE